jgi:multidrug efflux pump subunit AcrA (membrane-fusion protein)
MWTLLRFRCGPSRVLAPASGRVLRVLQQSAALEAVVDLLTTDAVHVRTGTPAVIVGWGGERGIKSSSGRASTWSRCAVVRFSARTRKRRLHTVRRVPVTLGHRGALDVEVLSGLGVGDVVVVHPGDRVEDRGSVKLAP